jgi:hypothetical protein
MIGFFKHRTGRLEKELFARAAEDEDAARRRHEADGYEIPPTAEFVDIDGRKAFVLEGHESHSKTVKVEEKEEVTEDDAGSA